MIISNDYLLETSKCVVVPSWRFLCLRLSRLRFFRYDGLQTVAVLAQLLGGNDTAMFGVQASRRKRRSTRRGATILTSDAASFEPMRMIVPSSSKAPRKSPLGP